MNWKIKLMSIIKKKYVVPNESLSSGLRDLDIIDLITSKARNNGVFSKWSRTFIELSEFREFREPEKSLRHLVQYRDLLCCLWFCG